MKSQCMFLASIVVLSALAAAAPASAQTGCSDVEFSSRITDRLPNAADSCLGIETRDGRQYAHFKAEIVGTSGNTVRTRFVQQDGGYSPTYSLEMDPSARVEINGRKYRYRELARGQQLDVYVPPDQWEFHVPETENFSVARSVAVVTPLAMQEEQELPSTASPVPALGLIGALLMLMGAGLAAASRRLP
jgi:hypothetical protein